MKRKKTFQRVLLLENKKIVLHMRYVMSMGNMVFRENNERAEQIMEIKKDKLYYEDNIMVSVVILSHNHEKYIRQTLESVLMQKTDFRYEILVGDDASSDATPQILEEYAHAYPDIFTIFLREKNIGATRNSYEILSYVKGKYIASLDGDDFWTDEEKLQVQVDFLESHPEFIGCSHRCLIVDERCKPTKMNALPWVSEKKIFGLRDFKGAILPGHPSTMMKRNIFVTPQYDYSIIYKAHPMICDRTTALIFLSQGNFYIMKRCMGAYRFRLKRNAGNLTSRLYLDDDDPIRMDYLYTCRLQQYAKEVLKSNGGFDDRKRNLFVSAVCRFVVHRDKRAMETAKMIFNEAEDSVSYIFSFPVIILQKLWTKMRLHF